MASNDIIAVVRLYVVRDSDITNVNHNQSESKPHSKYSNHSHEAVK